MRKSIMRLRFPLETLFCPSNAAKVCELVNAASFIVVFRFAVDWATLAKQWISMQQQPTHPMMPPVLPPPPAYSTDPGVFEAPGDDVLSQVGFCEFD